MKYLIPGLFLVVVFWILAWTQFSTISVYYFPPLWLGYILTINGVSELLYGDSLIGRMKWWFLLLFIFSIPMWWFFEFLNAFVSNWHYLTPAWMSEVQILILKSVSFSTVIPAVYSTAFLFWCMLDKSKRFQFSAFTISSRTLSAVTVGGVALLLLILAYPTVLFPFVWIAPLIILDPINVRLNFPSVIGELSRGRGKMIVAFVLGTLFTGFFWELWNFYSFPKWEYSIPYVDFLKIFEMPMIGYLGYIPFGLFVLTFTSLMLGLVGMWLGRDFNNKCFHSIKV